ncbi:acylphosphatase [Microbacterium fluvii]|uniref:acylphosphatase n=1 Tax=Microbacterium fluvii TaxID=415215 RepID=A0ABW2HEV8_9MICO|nr:acylphosphatase [Microbacterium fluvii]MCU4673468.1 acylphosphatase [Microbacterium fluvii]
MRRVHVIVRGEVQGVGYRYTLRMVATQEGVAGWVRNLRDGTVEAELEAHDDAVDAVLAWMAQGPPGSRVSGASVSELTPEGTRGFEVRRDG